MNKRRQPFLATTRTESLRRVARTIWIFWAIGLAFTVWLFYTAGKETSESNLDAGGAAGFLGIIVALLTFMTFLAALVASLMLNASKSIDAASTSAKRDEDVIDQ